MEFLDPVVTDTSTTPHEEGKTEQAVNQLENEIDKAYNSVEKKFGELWSAASKNAEGLQEKYHLEQRKEELLKQLTDAKNNLDDKAKVSEHLAQFESQIKQLGKQVHLPDLDVKTLGNQANSYLDNLDSKLEVVEQQAGKYVSQFTSFFSGIVSINHDEQPDDGNSNKQDKEILFTTKLGNNANYGTSRYESDLFKLHTTPELYLDEKLDDDGLSSFDVDAKTPIISDYLTKYDTTLEKVMNELVPIKLAYNVFWFRYFKLEDNLKQQDQQRKNLLDTKQSKKDNEDEEFTWDDEDEEEEPVDVGKESLKTSDNKDDDDDDWE